MLLTGAVAVTSMTAGCAGGPTKASTGEFIDDSVVTTRIKAALVKDDTTPAHAIKVDTFKGTVQLSGFVDTAEQKRRAGEIARGTDGVREVINNITVK
ncbi:MAG: transport-associated protein [Verrucomicrobia bacterium]|nr:transport-associated protein [Verrucomicrobiota bacterium]